MLKKITLIPILIISILRIDAQVNAFFFTGEPSLPTQEITWMDTSAATHWRILGADYFAGVTYMGWVDANETYKIIKYAHNAGQWSEFDTVGVNSYTLGADHAGPCVTVLRHGVDAGKIIYTANLNNTGRQNIMWKSNNAEDISSWSVVDSFTLSTTASWPQVVEFEDASLIYLFRVSTTTSRFRRSTDQGNTWSGDSLFLTLSGGGPYIKSVDNGSTIHLVINHRIVNSAATPEYQNIYYLYSDDYGYTWKKRNGTVVNYPLTISDLDTVFLSNPTEETRDSDIFLDSGGNPHILIVDDREKINGEPHYKVCSYSGTTWSCDSVTTTNTVVNLAGQNALPFGAFDPVDNAAKTLILSDENFRLAKWVKEASVWVFDSYISDSGGYRQARPIRVKNASDAIRIMYYESTDWQGGYPESGWGTNVFLRTWPTQRVRYN